VSERGIDDELADVIERHGMEAVLNAAQRWLREDAKQYRDGKESPENKRLVCGLLEKAADHCGDASLDYYVSTK
jgi:hypothetical protein